MPGGARSMKGEKQMIYKNITFKADPFSYNLEFDDRITLVGGDSGTGKTVLYEMLEDLRLTDEYKAIKLFNYKSDHFSESIEKCRDRDKNVYIQTAREYSEVILSNADGENWALRYFVAQIYLDLYKQTGSKEYLQKAYDIALNNVNVLVESQKELNLAYLSDIQEVSVNKEAEDEDREKKEVKQYNKLLKAQRKVELPPVDEALYLNCDLLFALAEQLDISVDEQKKIDAILHENGEPVFLTQALDEKFWFESAYKKLDVQNIDIDFDGKTLKIPAVCIADRSRITVSVDGSSGNQTFQDWTVKKVYRPKGADCSDFIVIFTSETAKKYKYESGDKIAVQITPVAESADEILEYDYKATVIQKAFAFKTISFERAAK